MKKFDQNSVPVLLAVLFIFGFGSINAHAATAPSLGVADGYSVFGKAGITTTGTTHVWGNAGADSSVGLVASQVSGSIVTDGDTAGVATAASAAYDNLDLGSQGIPLALDLAGTNTVTPGVYTVGATTLNGTLTLNGAGVYIFRSSSSISTSGAGTMSLTNGATACNVFWEIPASMTIGTSAHIEGTIIAKTGLISLATGASLKGRAISLISQVTLDANQITQPICAPATGNLHIIKHVINDNAGTSTASAFTVNVTGTNVSSSTFLGSETGVDVTLDAGSYSITETGPVGYTESDSSGCSGTIAAGETITCTITNNDIAVAPATLHVVKTVINDNDGTATASSFNLHVKLSGTDVAGSPAIGIASPGRSYTLSSGTYAVSEDADSSYTQSFSGDCDASGSLTLSAGETKTCTITNNDIAPVSLPASIKVVKTVINDNGGTKIAADFPLFVNGVSVVSGVANVFPASTLYTMTETSDSGYTRTFSGDCDVNGKLSLVAGDSKTCTITNNDIAPAVIPPAAAEGSTPPLVVAPAFPNTGFESEGGNASWIVGILSGIFVIILASIFSVLKKQKI